ncbi:peptidase M14 [bacterium]|nr:peptidase M14 [bacterium]
MINVAVLYKSSFAPRSTWIGTLSILFAFILLQPIAHAEIEVDARFPGGNIIVDRVEENDVYIHQDLRDTKGDWFYWYFRVRGAEGKTVRFHFTKSNVIGVLGPAYCRDGQNWHWLGKHAVEEKTFSFSFKKTDRAARFCFAIPYTQSNLDAFLDRYQENPQFQVDTLCTTKKGRKVERILLGCLSREPAAKVLLTCRHHACEMMASYTLEGMMESILTDRANRWLKHNVEFMVIPFVDTDGVEDGDQGKNRRPRDHNRDYAGESIYSSVKHLREWVPTWSDGKLRVAIDMHDPYIRGNMNEKIYFVCGPDEANSKNILQYSDFLEHVTQQRNISNKECLLFYTKNVLPWDTAWNKPENYTQGKSNARWTSELPGIWFGSTIEIPYANAEGRAVTAESARWLGRDMATALRMYLQKKLKP